jgi:hypothetical protein
MREEFGETPGYRWTAEQQRSQVGEDLLVPSAENADGHRRDARGDQPIDDGLAILDPQTKIRLHVMRDLVQENGLPRLIAIPGNADQRKGIALAQQSRQGHSAAHRRGE